MNLEKIRNILESNGCWNGFDGESTMEAIEALLGWIKDVTFGDKGSNGIFDTIYLDVVNHASTKIFELCFKGVGADSIKRLNTHTIEVWWD